MALYMYGGFSSCWLVSETMNLCVKEIARATILEIFLCDPLAPVFCVCDGSERKSNLVGCSSRENGAREMSQAVKLLLQTHKDGARSQTHH